MKKGFMNGLVLLTTAGMVFLAGCGNQAAVNNTTTTKATTAPVATAQTDTSTSTASVDVQKTADKVVNQKPDNVYMVIEPGSKLGSDGKLHDAYINGNITITVGKPVTLHIYNYDEGQHSYTAADLGLNIMAKASEKEGVPAITTYTFTPKKVGTFTWHCMVPCDEDNGDFSMTQDGYMMGTVKVVPAKDAVQHLSFVVNADYKLGSDGEMHDVVIPAHFTVNAGEKVEVTMYNFDDQFHSVVNKEIGLSVMGAGSTKEGVPGITKVTFTPQKAGQYEWKCTVPCDDWAMKTDGFMMGKVTVK
jgi:heme/copper-type cytochrome/quinol oxidase subunit 2